MSEKRKENLIRSSIRLEKAKYECMLCMDADLQHEPEAVPSVAAPVLNGDAEFTVGSRNVDGVALGWSGHGFDAY